MVLKLIRNLAPPGQAHNGKRATLLTALLTLSWAQLTQLFSGWLAQTCDSIDMFNVVMISSLLKEQFHQRTIVMMIIISLNYVSRIFGGVSTSLRLLRFPYGNSGASSLLLPHWMEGRSFRSPFDY
jgi:SHS family lactate transporter-like MFS transporter